MTFKSNVLNGFKQPLSSDNTSTLSNDNQFALYGTADINGTTISSVKIVNVFASNDITSYSAASAVAISGMALIAGGTGFNMTLAAPQEGCLADILLESISSGSVIIKTPSGVTFDGTNNTATFDAAADELILGYYSETQWQIFKNVSVTLSST